MKVADLYVIFEQIQRDIQELKETCNRIPKDREYSQHILHSIQEEIAKLESKKEMILNLEVQIPISIEQETTAEEVVSFEKTREVKTTPPKTIPPLIKKQTRRY